MLRNWLVVRLLNMGIRFIQAAFYLAGNGSLEVRCCPAMDRDRFLLFPLAGVVLVISLVSLIL